MKYCFGFGQTMSIIFCEKVPKYLDSINLTFKYFTVGNYMTENNDFH